MAYWVKKRSRGMIWFLLETVTLLSFFIVFSHWLLLLIKLDFYSETTLPFWQPIFTGLFSGWILFQQGECKYRRYLSKHPDLMKVYMPEALTAVNAMSSTPRK
jgi:hypothetical protein